MLHKKNFFELVIIIENYVNIPGIKAEHGWSVFIKKNKQKILMDCGQSNQILSNASKLNVDLEDLDKIVLSHNHADHTGGLLSILKKINKSVEVHAHSEIFKKSFEKDERKEEKYIGIPCNKKVYEKNGAIFILEKEQTMLGDGMYLTGQVKRVTSFEKVEDTFIKKIGSDFTHDNIEDDISLILDFSEGIVIVTGCAHSGIINIIEQAKRITGRDRFLAIIGGFHLKGKSDSCVDITIEELKKYNIKSIYPAHCVGLENYHKLKSVFSEKCNYGFTGRVISLESL